MPEIECVYPLYCSNCNCQHRRALDPVCRYGVCGASNAHFEGQEVDYCTSFEPMQDYQ